MVSSKAPSPSWLGKATTGQAHEYESALSPLYLWNLLQIGTTLGRSCLYQRIGKLRDRHMSMTLSFETFSTMEPLSSRGRSRLVLVFTKRELQGKHSWLSALRFFCGTFFDSRSLSTNLGLNQRGATRQADEFDTQSQVLAACGET